LKNQKKGKEKTMNVEINGAAAFVPQSPTLIEQKINSLMEVIRKHEQRITALEKSLKDFINNMAILSKDALPSHRNPTRRDVEKILNENGLI
jgi:exonuclease VII small subunit